MRTSQYILLGASVMGGILWVFLAQQYLFQNPLAEFFTGGGEDFQDYIDKGNRISFAMLWISCLIALLIWFFMTLSSKTRSSSDEVRQIRPRWWLMASILVCLGWLYQWIFSNAYSILPGGWMILMVFVLVDVLLLFWLPTLLASPRLYRLVVPGAVMLLGGR